MSDTVGVNIPRIDHWRIVRAATGGEDETRARRTGPYAEAAAALGSENTSHSRHENGK